MYEPIWDEVRLAIVLRLWALTWIHLSRRGLDDQGVVPQAQPSQSSQVNQQTDITWCLTIVSHCSNKITLWDKVPEKCLIIHVLHGNCIVIMGE